jgi:hypothetical protein
MKKRCLFINFIPALIVCSLTFIAGCQNAATPEQVIEKASRLIGNGNNENAIGLLRTFIYHHEDNYRAHFLLGQAFLNTDTENEKSLYIARYYFNKARDLAETGPQKEKADRAYADVKLLMGKGNQSGEILLDAAEQAGRTGRNGQAAHLCVMAASRFFEAAEYKKARKACIEGQKYAETESRQTDLKLGLATAYFLENEYENYAEELQGFPEGSELGYQITALDYHFLKNAMGIIGMKGEGYFKKDFNDSDKKIFESTFQTMADDFEETRRQLDEKKAGLYAEGWKIIAEHAKGNAMRAVSKQAYKLSQALFLKAGLEDEAGSIGDELKDLES